MKRLIVMLLLSIPMMAQTAKVIQLLPGDAGRIRDLENQRKVLDEQIVEFNKHVVDTYLLSETGKCQSGRRKDMDSKTDPNPTGRIFGGNVWGCETAEERKRMEAEYKKEQTMWLVWEKRHPELSWVWCESEDSFVYSDDYRFIVPGPLNKPCASGSYLGGISWGGSSGCLTVGPATTFMGPSISTPISGMSITDTNAIPRIK